MRNQLLERSLPHPLPRREILRVDLRRDTTVPRERQRPHRRSSCPGVRSVADYKEHHPHIVPPEYFRRLDVLEGGCRRWHSHTNRDACPGVTRVFEQVVTEPQPGRA
jgi:hypothetical protein